MISPPRMAASESFSLRTRAGAVAALSSATRWRLGTSLATLRRDAGRGLAMGVSTNISLLTKASHAGFRTKTLDFIIERRAAIKKNSICPGDDLDPPARQAAVESS